MSQGVTDDFQINHIYFKKTNIDNTLHNNQGYNQIINVVNMTRLINWD